MAKITHAMHTHDASLCTALHTHARLLARCRRARLLTTTWPSCIIHVLCLSVYVYIHSRLATSTTLRGNAAARRASKATLATKRDRETT